MFPTGKKAITSSKLNKKNVKLKENIYYDVKAMFWNNGSLSNNIDNMLVEQVKYYTYPYITILHSIFNNVL